MKANHRKATLVIVILLNLLLLGVCGWTLMTLLSPSDAPSEPDSSQSEPAPSSEEPSFPSVKPESSTPENSSPTLSLPEGLSLSDRFGNCYEAALNKLETLTIEEKLGQLLLCGVPNSGGDAFIDQYQPGGFVLFAKDFENRTADQIRSTLQGYQDKSRIPMVFSVDEEGGEIVRVSKFSSLRETSFPAPKDVYASGGLPALEADAAEKSRFLLDFGIQLNLAPVCDIAPDRSTYIYARTFGVSAKETADCVRTVVTAMESAGISSCLKHFPGYGGNADTHTGVSVDDRSMETFRETDFLPFQAGIDAGAETVLVSHNTVTAMDPNVPASLSPEVHRILREELHFTGIILTDALEMEAIVKFAGNEHPAVVALRAGNDLILQRDGADAFNALKEALDAGAISEEAVDLAVTRILAWKLSKGILTE